MSYLRQLPDQDEVLTGEWLDSLDALVGDRGQGPARQVLARLLRRAAEHDIGFPATVTTPYVNTIARADEPDFPGDEEMERRIEAFVIWNTAVMVSRANSQGDGVGGHLATPASCSSLYEVGFNHFFRGKDDGAGDQVYFQGHAVPAVYARAYVEGRLTEHHLDRFRREVGGGGLSSYPHPRLMPEFWEFPTVSMGLGPLNAVYQARFNRYLLHRGITDTTGSDVWCFIGDGECDEPETTAALTLAARECLDNLTFVINCNLQRLDGPVRGNGKVIQELEGVFRGAGWKVIKVIWGSEWDDVLANDVHGALVERMGETLDGQYQKFSVEPGTVARQEFFGADPRLAALVESRSDDDPIFGLPRGGHDHRKIYAAYHEARHYRGAPTVILAKTVKGFGLGTEIEGRNAAHQIKTMKQPQLAALRDRLGLTALVSDEALAAARTPYLRPPDGSPEHNYLISHRRALGGALPRRVVRAEPAGQPDPTVFDDLLGGSDGRAVSTTMAFAGLLRSLLRDPTIGRRVVPIVPDEARTFGLDALFSEVKIYAPGGQRYEPVDASMQLSYREDRAGQILEEGITEAGALSSFTAAGTSYATWGEPMIPFYLFYSMFGFQRVGDQVWAFGDMRGRGFLLGATAGRTTLNGEGLQHQDGHSLLLASSVPNVAAYDPAFAYEVAVLVEEAVRRTLGPEPEDRFWYITLYNENYVMPPLPEGEAGEEVRRGVLRGMYRFAGPPDGGQRRATLLFSGVMWQAAMEARDLLQRDWNVAADAWSVTSYAELRSEALSVERWNRLHPAEAARTAYVQHVLGEGEGPVVAVTDYVRSVPDQIARWVPRPFTSLGTDGFGRSDTRGALRRFFEIDAAHLVVAVLSALAVAGEGKTEDVAQAIERYGISPDAADPWLTAGTGI